MRLSEAMKLGAMMKPQAFGKLYDMPDVLLPGEFLGLHTERVASCALGAAFDAGGCVTSFDQAITYGAPPEWVMFLSRDVRCPACRRLVNAEVRRVIEHLNDCHRWSREKIAEWVQTLEEKDSERPEEAMATNAVREETGQPHGAGRIVRPCWY